MDLPIYAPDVAAYRAGYMGLRVDFIYWLGANESIWREFCELANLARSKGRARWSADAIFHVIRWHRMLRDQMDCTFKVNNNWTSCIARLYNSLYEVEFFELRDRAYNTVKQYEEV